MSADTRPSRSSYPYAAPPKETRAFLVRFVVNCSFQDYTFVASQKLPWYPLWAALWRLIPEPLTDGRLLVAGKGETDTHLLPDVEGLSNHILLRTVTAKRSIA